MKKISIIIIGFVFLTTSLFAQKATVVDCTPVSFANFNVVFDHGLTGSYPVQYYATVVYKGGTPPAYLVTEMLGQPNPYIIIDGSAFNDQDPCYTLEFIEVEIKVYKKVDGVSDWTLVRYGDVRVDDIFYFDYPNHTKTVYVTLQAVQGLN